MSQENGLNLTPRYPTEFQLAALKIRTVIDDKIIQENRVGAALYHRQEIKCASTGAPYTTLEQAYVHELVHWILFVMGRCELRDDEQFVDGFAQLLYQAATTMRWE